ncbi:MAG: N-acetylneuraminate synthase family protein [Acidobacteria bacterium]|nr:N-acetylneuraminate synthase family protein [Acidobacteriota bacterium]
MSSSPSGLQTGRSFIIGEVGLAHDGSLGYAHAFVDEVARAGADAVKFQTHIAEAESTATEPFRVAFSRKDATRYDYWKRLEFSEAEWQGLADHARDRGLVFLSSPFSREAVQMLTRVGMAMWKVGSGEVGNLPLLDAMTATGRPVILSSGMSDLSELDSAVARVRHAGVQLAVLQCTTAYPCPPERIGLNMMQVFRDRYGCFVGLSDHSGTVYPGIAAAALGADVLEVHVTMSRGMFGPDVPASVTMEELRVLVDGVRFVERMQANPVDKDAAARDVSALRDIFTKSLVAQGDLPVGTVLTESHLGMKKPGTGIPANQLASVVGRRLRRSLVADEQIRTEDLE